MHPRSNRAMEWRLSFFAFSYRFSYWGSGPVAKRAVERLAM
jgi:hypothetical protein